MNDIRSRLMRCFAAVFPQLSEHKITAGRLDTLDGWDSVAAATLVTTIEEEFETELDIDASGTLTSFRTILDYLTRKSDA